MRYFASVLKLFPQYIMDELLEISQPWVPMVEEIRVRVGESVVLRGCFGEIRTKSIVTRRDMRHLIINATDCSYHTHLREIEKGYITLPNGCRMGLCGSGCGGILRSMREIDSVCIRIAREQRQSGDGVYTRLFSDKLYGCVIIGPPGAGKTSLLRELIKRLSAEGYYVGVADERGEISGGRKDEHSFDLGQRTDVMRGVCKSDGAVMLLRSMSPHVIAMDEITAAEDLQAVEAIMKAGVKILATIHGDGVSSLHKPSFKPIYDAGVFEKAVVIDHSCGNRRYTVEELYA